jgi:hypothetical protein
MTRGCFGRVAVPACCLTSVLSPAGRRESKEKVLREGGADVNGVAKRVVRPTFEAVRREAGGRGAGVLLPARVTARSDALDGFLWMGVFGSHDRPSNSDS